MTVEEEYSQLIQKAFFAMQYAYAPYSGYRVGACVRLKDGREIVGANIENAAYGSCMCAERNAVYGAYCQGYKKEDIEALAIASDGKEIVTPCGACRQVLSELLDPDTPIVLAGRDGCRKTDMKTLLPMSFGAGNMEKD